MLDIAAMIRGEARRVAKAAHALSTHGLRVETHIEKDLKGDVHIHYFVVQDVVRHTHPALGAQTLRPAVRQVYLEALRDIAGGLLERRGLVISPEALAAEDPATGRTYQFLSGLAAKLDLIA